MARFASLMTYSVIPASGGGQLISIELPVHPAFVEVAGQVTFFLAAGNASSQSYTASAKVDISSVEGILLMQRFSAAQVQLQASQGGGSVRPTDPRELLTEHSRQLGARVDLLPAVRRGGRERPRDAPSGHRG